MELPKELSWPKNCNWFVVGAGNAGWFFPDKPEYYDGDWHCSLADTDCPDFNDDGDCLKCIEVFDFTVTESGPLAIIEKRFDQG